MSTVFVTGFDVRSVHIATAELRAAARLALDTTANLVRVFDVKYEVNSLLVRLKAQLTHKHLQHKTKYRFRLL